MPANPISAFNPVIRSKLEPTDQLAIVHANETKRISASDLFLGTVDRLPNKAIDGKKVDTYIAPNEILTIHIADHQITAEKLHDDSVCIVQSGKPVTGAFVGQVLLDTSSYSAYIWDGTAWQAFTTDMAVDSVTVTNNANAITVTGSVSGTDVQLTVDYGTTTNPGEFIAGPTAAGGTVSARQIVAGDLPEADGTDIGIARAGSGLEATGGTLSIDNTVTPQPIRGVATWDANGLVTGGGTIQPYDLPSASKTELGAVVLGDHLNTDAAGELIIDNPMTPGLFPKIAYNEVGLVVGGFPLEKYDLPQLSITDIDVPSGSILGSAIVDNTLTSGKFDDEAFLIIQEAKPQGQFKGQCWYQPSSGQLWTYEGGHTPVAGRPRSDVWLPIGFGKLSQENLRWCGTIDASTGKIIRVTAEGQQAGFVAGANLPVTLTDSQSGCYFVTEKQGAGMGALDGITNINFDPGDWLLAVNQAQGYVHIDVMLPGFTGKNFLYDLLDTDITPTAGNQNKDAYILVFDGSKQKWENLDAIHGGKFAVKPADAAPGLQILNFYSKDIDPGDPTLAFAPQLSQVYDGELALNLNPADPSVWMASHDPATGGARGLVKLIGKGSITDGTGTYVALDDKGTQQSIVGGGGLDLAGPLNITGPHKATSALTVDTDPDPTLTTKSYVKGLTGGLDARVTTAESKITALEAWKGTTTSSLSSITGRITANEGKITSLESKVTANGASIGGLTTKLSALTTKVNGNSSSLTSLGSRITATETTLSSLTSGTNSVSNIATTVSKLSGYLSGVTDAKDINNAITAGTYVTGSFTSQKAFTDFVTAAKAAIKASHTHSQGSAIKLTPSAGSSLAASNGGDISIAVDISGLPVLA